ncbi:hypothetical protein CGGC5_v003535 [Colletotrichum fructicola Nara gc5]|uniref:Uncharacterized protein n=1 Tax=Colletotrichum fructicola (strain Nara gc5) TaxID=1213859 RepID=A0A7J6JEN5_COLFN|nr:hypothetical protein CGGC5_v003535 [Colletotrichum fructicola Nara gc5]
MFELDGHVSNPCEDGMMANLKVLVAAPADQQAMLQCGLARGQRQQGQAAPCAGHGSETLRDHPLHIVGGLAGGLGPAIVEGLGRETGALAFCLVPIVLVRFPVDGARGSSLLDAPGTLINRDNLPSPLFSLVPTLIFPVLALSDCNSDSVSSTSTFPPPLTFLSSSPDFNPSIFHGVARNRHLPPPRSLALSYHLRAEVLQCHRDDFCRL